MKILIVYYSLTGNTRLMADIIRQTLNLDETAMLEIKPVKDFAAGKFSTYMWGGFQAKMSSTPELQPYDLDVGQYDLIFLGTPVWAWTLAPPVRSFVEKEAAKLKTAKLALFACSGGDGRKAMERFEKFLQGYTIIGTRRFIEPKSSRPEEQKEKAIAWAKEMIAKVNL